MQLIFLNRLRSQNLLQKPLRHLYGLMCVVLCGLWAGNALAATADPAGGASSNQPVNQPLNQGGDFIEGTHYQKIPIPVQTQVPESAGDAIEVVEVFSYGCIHCFHFDPVVDGWAKSADDVAFRRTPAIFNASWALLARAFYTAEVLGVSEQMHQPLFHAIHKNPINLGDPELMARLFRTEAGVSPEAFSQAFDSFTVRSRVQQADGHGRAYRVRAVPSMVVAGKYLVDSSMVGNRNDEMLRVVDFLIERERAEATE